MKLGWVIAATLVTAPIALHAAAPDILATPGRPESDVKLDASRKPVETLAFLGVKPGDAALDWEAGGGYYTRLLASAVGPKGKVTAWGAAQFMNDDKAKERWADIRAKHRNVTLLVQPFESFSAPANSYNFALFHLSYHDAYWADDKYKVPGQDPKILLANLYKAMKPGGTVGVVDHVGAAGVGARESVQKFHRIDPAVVTADFAKAGFRLVGESPHLRAEGDDYAKSVFDEAVRGKTDRFVLKFVKPK